MLPPDAIRSREVDKWDAAQYLGRFIPQANYNRRQFDRVFYRNILFLAGQQWIRYNRTAQQWRPINVPEWFPKQVTNKFAVACDSMKSVFDQSKPVTVYSPGQSGEHNVSAAETAQTISGIIDTEVDNDKLREELSAWVTVTGNGFIVDGYDNSDSHGTKFLQHFGCLSCGMVTPPHQIQAGCPACGGTAMIPAQGPQGPIGEQVPIGKMVSEVASPFEVHFDLQSISVENSPYIFRAKVYPTETIKSWFPDDKESIKADGAGTDTGLFYQAAVAYLSNATSISWGNYGGPVGSVDNVDRTTLYHLWVRPCEELPEGGEAMIAGQHVLWKSDISTHDDKGNPFVPVTHFKFKGMPGRIYGRTPADDLIFKQVQRNKIEALLQIGLERTANPTWLLPKGIGIEQMSGEPGEKLWYNGFLQNLKPERIPGMEMPGSLFRWIEKIDEDFEDLAGTYDVLKGENPKGVPTLGGTQMLMERGLSRFADGLNNWGRGWTNVRRNRLYIWKEFAADARNLAIFGKNNKWEVQSFSNASIQGNIDVQLDEGTVQPNSKAYQQMVTGQLLQAQLLDLSDPEIKMKVLQRFDAGDLVEGLDTDVKDAIKEKEAFLQSGQVRLRPLIDNHAIHVQQHIKDAKKDEFFSWPPQLQLTWMKHIQAHQQIMSQMALQQAQMQAQTNPAMIMKMQEGQAKLEEAQMKLKAQFEKHQIDLTALGLKKGLELGKIQETKPALTAGNGSLAA